MKHLPENAYLVVPTLKDAVREQERLIEVWLQDEVNELNTKMVAELTAVMQAHKDMLEVIGLRHLDKLGAGEAQAPDLKYLPEDYEIDN